MLMMRVPWLLDDCPAGHSARMQHTSQLMLMTCPAAWWLDHWPLTPQLMLLMRVSCCIRLS